VRRHSGQRGLSLMEMTVVMAVATTVVLICYEVIESGLKASLFSESHNDVTVLAQRPVNMIQNEVFQSKAIFQNTTEGAKYYDNFISILPSGLKNLNDNTGDTTYPTIDTQLGIVPDTSTTYVGNCLLVAKQLAPVYILWDDDGNAATPKIYFSADVYEFQFFYLRKNTARSFSSQGYYIDLMHGWSVKYADAFQLQTSVVGKTDAATIATGLSAAGVTRAWDPTSSTFAGSLFDITSAGALTAANPNTLTLETSDPKKITRSMIPELIGGRVSGKMEYSVAFRTASKTFPILDVVPKWAVYATATPYYPSGFEVKIVGTGSGQKVLTRLVMMTNYGANKYDSKEGAVITSIPTTNPF
jgi:hypothetical protein